MSKAELVITAVIVEGRTQAEVAAEYGVSKGWVSKLIARYNAEGQAAFEPRSRRPKTSPWAIDAEVVELILELREKLTNAGHIVTATFRQSLAQHGIPASTLTDNGMVYTVRLAGGRGGRNTFENELRRLHIVQKNSRPAHPTTCGKVERFQQTMKKWLHAQPAQPRTITELQALLAAFVQEYNHHRPHRSLPHRATPAARYDTMPKALPGAPATTTPTTASATTASTKPAQSPSATTAGCTTSASGEPTREPASSCSSKTSTSASSTRSPAN